MTLDCRMASGKLQNARRRAALYADRVARLERALSNAKQELRHWTGRERSYESQLGTEQSKPL